MADAQQPPLPDPLAQNAGFDAIIRQRTGQIEALDQDANRRQGELDAGIERNAAARDRTLRPMEDAARAAIGDEQHFIDTATPPASTLPQWKPQPIIDGKDFEQLSFGLIGMALIGGIASKGNWLGVSASLNGALKGYLDGNKQRADKEFKDYQTKYQEALDHDTRAQKRFEEILNNKNLSINNQLAQIKLAAAQYDRQDVLMAAQQKSIDGIRRQVESSRNALDALQGRNDTARMQMQLGMDRLKSQSGGVQNLDPAGNWFLMSTVANGNTKFEQMLASRYGGQVGAMVVNSLGKLFQENGWDPAKMTEEQLNLLVQKSVQTQASNRLAGVERLTNAIKPLEDQLSNLVQKLNANGLPPANATFNSIRSKLGDEDYSEMQVLLGSVGRQYIEAMTMPGSNAQLHATAQDWADGIFNPNMNMAQVQGIFKGMNLEISSTHNALLGAVQRSQQSVTGQGIKIPAPGGEGGAQPVPLDQYLQGTP